MVHAGGVVLCGGRSSRMGRPKAWLPVGDEFMLQRVVRVVASVVRPVVVVAAPGQDVPPLPDGVEVVRDEAEGLGPLAGLAAGLAAVQGRAEVVYLSACDVPLLRSGFVRNVVSVALTPQPPLPVIRRCATAGEGERDSRLSSSPLPSFDSVEASEGEGPGVRASCCVPRVNNYSHPLAAAYRVDLLPVVRSLLAAGERRMAALFDAVPTRFLGPADFADVDPHLESLRNVNTPEEYAAVFGS